MKTKMLLALACAAACTNVHAQNTFPNNGNVGIGTLSPATSLQVIGVGRFGSAANYAQFDGSGNLNFTGSGNYRVGGNRYAFQYSGNPNYGLFFNSTNTRYEFRDGTAVPVFYINANDGNGVFTAGVKVGNSTNTSAGTMRWNGNDFQGYNGSSWVSFTATGGGGGWSLTGNSGTTAGTNFIGTTDNAAFAIRTNNAERLRITSDGRAGIGTTVPSAKLHVNSADGEDGLRVQIDGSTTLFVSEEGGVSVGSTISGPADGLYVSGNVGIGNSAPVNKLDVSGNVGITGNLVANSTGTGITFYNGQYLRDNSANTSLELEVHADVLPDTDNAHGLGNSTQRWTDLWALDGTINTSDEKDKQNIRDLSYGLKEIMKLRSVKFNWKNATKVEDKLGLIAQELQKVLPEVVRNYEYKVDEASGKATKVPAARLGVMYADIIPVLIKGMQQQQQMIEEQARKMEELTKLVNQLTQNSTAGSITTDDVKSTVTGANLEQNAPNPFNNVTSIRYHLPVTVNKAQIMVANASGIIVKTFTLTSKGAGTVTIHANELAAGSYRYTLVADGKKVESRQMLLIK